MFFQPAATSADSSSLKVAFRAAGCNARVRHTGRSLRVCLNGNPSDGDRALAAMVLFNEGFAGVLGSDIFWAGNYQASVYHMPRRAA